jgi:Undecaprenyl-phosphate galactose phosphotransferase WbaP
LFLATLSQPLQKPGTLAQAVAQAKLSSATVRVNSRPWLSVLLLVLADLVALCLAIAITVGLRYALDGRLRYMLYLQLWPVLILFVLIFAAVGLYSGLAMYPGVAIGPADELRRSTLATTLVFLGLAAMTFLLRVDERGSLLRAEQYSRSVFLLAWLVALVSVPIGRATVRRLFTRRDWWGYPVAILGAGVTASMVVHALRRFPELGLKPVVALDDDPAKHGELDGIPVLGGLDQAPALARDLRITYAIVAMPGASPEQMKQIYRQYGDVFPHLLLIPNLVGFSSLWVVAKDLGGVVGLEVRQRLLLAWPRLLKRSMDLIATSLGLILLIPLMALIALLVKLESPGPAFFSHDRIGRGGRRFSAWKFRSMRHDADEVLAHYLQQHPELREQWERDHKLRDDPRVTRIGRFLRKTSLDELPQLVNVLKGEMSLVGPRPIVNAEIERYDEHYSLYLKVRPGITGLWQVSGRNDTTYAERVNMDAYYVRNWSVWLDLHILSRTMWVVLFGRGAY